MKTETKSNPVTLLVEMAETDRQLAARILDILQKKPYLIRVDEEVSKVENGVVMLELRVHKGFVTDVVATSQKRYTFTNVKKN